MAVPFNANNTVGVDKYGGVASSMGGGGGGGGVGAVINDEGKRFRVRLPDGEILITCMFDSLFISLLAVTRLY